MRGVCVWALLVPLFGIIKGDSSIFSGFLGCRFSQSVCRSDEECFDDRLFGVCQRLDQPVDTYQYFLSASQLHELESVIADLIQSGNTWEELYTQCVLSNILLAYRQHRSYDPYFCDNGGMEQNTFDDDISDATVDLLKSYLEDYYRANQNTDYADLDTYGKPFPVQKKDEVVQVHKYLKSHKRDPALDYPELERDYGSDDVDLFNAKDSGIDLSSDDILRQLSPDKLKLLEEYLGPLTTDNTDDSNGSGKITVSNVGQSIPTAVGQSLPTDGDYAVVAPIDFEDATLLDQLLQGTVSVADLNDEQIAHLSRYVDNILQPLRQYGSKMDDNEILEGNDDDETVDSASDNMVPERDLDELSSELLDTDALHSASDVNIVKKIHPNEPSDPVTTPRDRLSIVDLDMAYIKVKPPVNSNKDDAARILIVLERHLGIVEQAFTDIVVGTDKITFRVNPNSKNLNASEVAKRAEGEYRDDIKNQSGFDIFEAGTDMIKSGLAIDVDRPRYFVLTFVLCGVILGIVLSVIAIYIVRRHLQSKEKLAQLATAADGIEASNDYQDLCRQRMQSKSSEKPEPLHISSRMGSVSASEGVVHSPSSRSSTSSRSEEPVVSNMDISTGHIVLAYMEDHLKNKDRLDQEWEALCVYEAEPNSTAIGSDAANMRKNKYSDVLPYDHSRVILTPSTNVSGSDYINASTITDHDPRNPAYICTQGPLPHTVADFWQMVWEQGSVVIVNLTKLTENGQSMCHRYWPEEGSDLYHIYEVHLVSEHIWCDEYLVRCFYLKNLQTNETRTVSQFHYVAWSDLGIPTSAKALLDFRRKVNKSYRGQNCPIVVHCSDGSGRSGSYCLLDMVLNRMSKGAKEIDIAATLEHIRDQRSNAVKTKEQFEFVLVAVAEEVHAILKSLPQ